MGQGKKRKSKPSGSSAKVVAAPDKDNVSPQASGASGAAQPAAAAEAAAEAQIKQAVQATAKTVVQEEESVPVRSPAHAMARAPARAAAAGAGPFGGLRLLCTHKCDQARRSKPKAGGKPKAGAKAASRLASEGDPEY